VNEPTDYEAASNVLGPCLLHLSEICGCEIVLAGHSLGAGVAALLAALLLPRLPALRCVGFATPSCAAGEASWACSQLEV